MTTYWFVDNDNCVCSVNIIKYPTKYDDLDPHEVVKMLNKYQREAEREANNVDK